MKPWAYIAVILAASAGIAYAGMRHPIEQGTAAAVEVERTQVHNYYSSSTRIMPDRVQEAPRAAVPQPAPKTAARPQQPGKAQKEAQKEARAVPGPQRPQAAPSLPRGPVPRAPGLPSADRINVPSVHIPNAPGGDGLLTLKPEPVKLRGSNRAQIHSFLKKARAMKMTNREYSKEVHSADIVKRYRDALNPGPRRTFRTAYKLSLAGIGKIQDPPPVSHYLNMVKRMDSLFDGLELSYPRAVLALWQLSSNPTNAKNLQARDALFAGILSNRAGWEAPAANLFALAAAKRVDAEDRYLGILWQQLESFEHSTHIDHVVSKVNPARARAIPLTGDKANYAMAKRMQLEQHRAPLAVNPSPEKFVEQIVSRSMSDRYRLLSLVGELRSPKEGERSRARDTLRTIEAESDEANRQEARLALARSALREGSPLTALALYRAVAKNGKNRLEVMAEQTYAEYLNGEFQESLGKAVALQSPYFVHGFSPDIQLVEILSRKALCDFGGAEASVKKFTETYGKELSELEASVAAAGKSSEAYYEKLISFYDLENPMRHQRFLLQVPAVMENQKTMNQALGDLEKIDQLGLRQRMIERPEGWDTFTKEMRASWTARARELRKESSKAALKEAAYMAKRLRNTFTQVELLDLDISTSASKNYNRQSALNFPAHKVEEAELDKDKFRWPFESEVWEDEIDFMRAKNPSKCAVAASL